MRAFLARASASIPDCRITIEKISDNHSCFRHPSAPFALAMRDSVARVRRRPAKFTTSTGFNDMHFFAHHLKIPTLGHGPGGEDCHAVDERASLRELLASARIYAGLIAGGIAS